MARGRVLMMASEAAPFARTGGLGDVIGVLPIALSKQGYEVRVFIPRYAGIDRNRFKFEASLRPHSVAMMHGPETATFENTRLTGVEYYLVSGNRYFERPGIYQDPVTGKDYPDNDERFCFFCLAVLEATMLHGWKPDVIHVHDWQTAITPALCKYTRLNETGLGQLPTVLTIHNLGYQGIFESSRFKHLGLPQSLIEPVSGPFEFYGKMSFLKAGIALADVLTTVSPRYAREITESAEFGAGLEGVLKERKSSLVGILNGVDYGQWSPTRDKHISYTYSAANLTRKRMNKVELLRTCGMPQRLDTPLIAMISRLAEQKGFDLIESAGEELLSLDLQMIVLGKGEARYQQLLMDLQKAYPEKLRVFLTFDEPLSHKIEAAADMFLMPSRYEPCGLNQMYSMKYGTVPIVRKVGGLADSVTEFDESTGAGTGFLFEEYSASAMMTAIKRGLAVFEKKRVWSKLVKNGMSKDFSWSTAASKYAEIYESVMNRSS